MKIQQTSLGQYVHCLSFQPCWRIKPSYDHVSNGRNTVTFELILLQTQRRSNWLDEIWCWSPNYKISSYHSSLFTRTEGYRRTWLHYKASHHGGSSCSVTDSDGRFSLPSQSCANLETELSNYSPIEFTNACTTHNAKRWRQTGKHGYSTKYKYTAKMLQKKASYPLNNCRTSGFYGSLFLVQKLG